MKKVIAITLTALTLAFVGCNSSGSSSNCPEVKAYRESIVPMFKKSQDYALKCCQLNEAARKKIEDQKAAAEESDDDDMKIQKIDSTMFPTSFASMSTEEAQKARENFMKSFAWLMRAAAEEAKLLPIVTKRVNELTAKLNAEQNPFAKVKIAAEAKELAELAGYLAEDGKYIAETMAFYGKYAAANNIAEDAVQKLLANLDSDEPQADNN